MRLNREIIVKRALELVNEIGFEKLTTRRLGKELGVEGPALYRHFKSMSELTDQMAAAILLPVLQTVEENEKWDKWLERVARESAAAVSKYRDGAKIVAESLPIEPLDLISKPLTDAGFRPETALYASKLFTSFMMGWQLREDHELERANRAEPNYNHENAFDFALGSVLDGLRARLKKEKQKSK